MILISSISSEKEAVPQFLVFHPNHGAVGEHVRRFDKLSTEVLVTVSVHACYQSARRPHNTKRSIVCRGFVQRSKSYNEELERWYDVVSALFALGLKGDAKFRALYIW